MWYLLLTSYFIITLLLHSLLCHKIKFSTALTKFFIVSIPLGILMIFHAYNKFGLNMHAFSIIFTYAFACELYIFMFTFVSSSISVSILLNFRTTTKEKTIDRLKEEYSPKKMVANRIRRLIEIELLLKENENIGISRKGKLLITVFNFLKYFFRLEY